MPRLFQYSLRLSATILFVVVTCAMAPAQNFSDSFESGTLNAWTIMPAGTAIFANYYINNNPHTGVHGAECGPGLSGLVRIRRSNFSACVGMFTVWFKLRGPSVDSRIRILASADGRDYYEAWFNPVGTDNPIWQILACEHGVIRVLIDGGANSIPAPQRDQWFKFSFIRFGDGRLSATIDDGAPLTVVDTKITVPGGMEIPAWQDVSNEMIFDDVSAAGISDNCITGGTPSAGGTASLQFSGVYCGTQHVDSTIDVCNTGGGTLNVKDVTFSGTDAASFSSVGFSPFSLDGGMCGFIPIQYTPGGAASTLASGVMHVQTDATNIPGGMLDIPLLAKLDSVAFVASPRTIEFGELNCQALPVTLPLSIRADGTIKATIGFSPVTQPFSLFSDSLNLPILPGRTRTIAVNLNATVDGESRQVLTLLEQCGHTESIILHAKVHAPTLAADNPFQFGSLLCDTVKIIQTIIRNSGSLRTVIHTPTAPPQFEVVPLTDSLLDTGGAITLTLRFHPNQFGLFSDTLRVPSEECGGTMLNIPVSGTKERTGIAFGNVQSDTLNYGAVCPTQLPKDTTIDIVNLSTAINPFTRVLNAPFSLLGNIGFPLAPGERRTVRVRFTAATDGAYADSLVLQDTCGNVITLYCRAKLETPKIAVQALYDSTFCPGTPAVFHVPVRNDGISQHYMTASCAQCAATPGNAMIVPGSAATFDVSFPGFTTSGSRTFTLLIADDCGGTYPVSLHVTQHGDPGLISLWADTTHIRDGKSAVVDVQAASPQALSNIDSIAFRITADITALQFDSVTSANATVSHKQIAPHIVEVAVTGITSSANPIATMHYTALVGSTLSPEVRIDPLPGKSLCATTTSALAAIVPLAAHGCELSTVLVNPFTTSIQTIFPNPASGQVTVGYTLVENVPVRITLTNALGEMLRTIDVAAAKPGTYSALLPTDGLENGVYAVTLRAGTITDSRMIGLLK